MKTYIQTVSLALLSLIVGAGLTSCTVVEEGEYPPHENQMVRRGGPPPEAYPDQMIPRERAMTHHGDAHRVETGSVVRRGPREESRPLPRPRPRPDVRNGGVVRKINARTGEVMEEMGYKSEAELAELPADKTQIRPKEDAVFYNPDSGALRGDAPSHLNASEVDDILRKRSMNRGKQGPQAPAHAHSPAPARAASRVSEVPCPSDGVTDAAIEETVEEDPLPFKADPDPAPAPKKAAPRTTNEKDEEEEDVPAAPLLRV